MPTPQPWQSSRAARPGKGERQASPITWTTACCDAPVAPGATRCRGCGRKLRSWEQQALR